MLWVHKERSQIVLVNIGSAGEVRDDQPASENQLCMGPDWNPALVFRTSYSKVHFNCHASYQQIWAEVGVKLKPGTRTLW